SALPVGLLKVLSALYGGEAGRRVATQDPIRTDALIGLLLAAALTAEDFSPGTDRAVTNGADIAGR
ncbi:MAG: hypothetical protein ACKPB8_09160, partial [Alphaproteobacteria bacterium]